MVKNSDLINELGKKTHEKIEGLRKSVSLVKNDIQELDARLSESIVQISNCEKSVIKKNITDFALGDITTGSPVESAKTAYSNEVIPNTSIYFDDSAYKVAMERCSETGSHIGFSSYKTESPATVPASWLYFRVQISRKDGMDITISDANSNKVWFLSEDYALVVKKVLSLEEHAEDDKSKLIAESGLIPSVVYSAINRPFSVYYDNVFSCDNIDNYDIISSLSSSSQFANYGNRQRFKPTSATQRNVVLTAMRNGIESGRTSFRLIPIDDTVKPNIKAIFIGDSFTNKGQYISELKNLMGDALTLYGTRSVTVADADGNNRTVDIEGRNGWSLKEYVNSASYNSITNAFYNPSIEKFDFGYYVQNNPQFADVTDVFLLSGPNDYSVSYSTTDEYMVNMKHILDSIKAYRTSIRIHIMLPIHCVSTGYSLGSNIGQARRSYNNGINAYCRAIINEYDGRSGYSVIPTNINIDTENDFGWMEVNANDRNPTAVLVNKDYVHPQSWGYFNMADMIYGDILGTCN